VVVEVVVQGVAGVVDPVGTDDVRAFSLELSAKVEESDEVGHRPFRVGAFGGEIGEAFLDASDGGLNRGYELLGGLVLRGQVFGGWKGSGFFIHDWNLAGGVGAKRGGIFQGYENRANRVSIFLSLYKYSFLGRGNYAVLGFGARVLCGSGE
jgi:hypothetical protein